MIFKDEKKNQINFNNLSMYRKMDSNYELIVPIKFCVFMALLGNSIEIKIGKMPQLLTYLVNIHSTTTY